LRRALVGTLAGPRKKFQFEGSPKNMSEKTQKFQTNKHTMWIGNVRNLSFQDQLRATIAVDLNELSMTPLDFDRNLAKGLSARDMRMMAADAGVSLPILDPMASWAPHWRSGISDAAWMEFLGYSADDFFRIAEQLGVSTMTVIGTFQPGLVAIPETAESFAQSPFPWLALCARVHSTVGYRRLGIGVADSSDREPSEHRPCVRLLALHPGRAGRRALAIDSGKQDLLCSGNGRRSFFADWTIAI
jgi:hypothetical protein